ncbi:TrmH family RNA methyltransferase [Catenulispora pinisilvae]|uniref:TrmH family RNA methyltransferase n=1 Tax=Catenulispora pinisilvae TaxID=2705253 RepID=UPI001890BC67|nr:RNA methyltransferase [Catenulispora pinisilvae]
MSEASPELSNPRAPRAVAARRLVSRSFRAKQRLFLAEGPQAVREAAELEGVLVELFATREAADRYGEIVQAAGRQGSKITIATPDLVQSLSETVTPQGLIGVCRFLNVPLEDFLAERTPKLVALLAHVRDPGNAGTVIRCADAAGADLVVVTAESVDVYNPKAVRASAGSLFHVPVALDVSAADAVRALRAVGLLILAADGTGAADLDDELDSGRLAQPTCWLFGNEAWGLPESLLGLADEAVRVPIHGRAESLNLATASAVCLYSSARAQR